MTTFESAIALTLRFEGGYVNDPRDAGGETNWGISKRSYPSLDIKHLTHDQAAEIYYRDFWLAARCDRLPDTVAVAHFDTAVNCGVGTAAMFLQRALGTVNVDGIIGPATLVAVWHTNAQALSDGILWARLRHYFDISSRPSQLGFLRGWILRVLQLRAYLLTGVLP